MALRACSGALRQVCALQAVPAGAVLLPEAAVAAAQRITTGSARWASAQSQGAPAGTASSGAQATAEESAGASGSSSTSSDASGSGAGSGDGSSSSSAGASGAGASGAGAFGSFKSTFESFKGKVGGGSSGGGGGGGAAESLGSKAARMWATAVRDVRDAVLPRDDAVSLTKAYTGPVYQPGDEPYDGPSALAAVKRDESRFEKAWADLQAKYGHHPLFQRLRALKLGDSTVVRKGAEVVEDLRERYETSDNPVVHKVEDIKERVFGKTDAASAMATILSRDPAFDMSRLLAGVKKDAPLVVKAFLTHDLATLGQHCGPELMERFSGIFRHFEAEGLLEDPTILFVGDVELVELKAIEDEPLVVVQFACQQIKCTRDKFGNVVDGSPNSIQRVFYFWGLQQEAAGAVLPSGRVLPPRWVIKDMMWQSMLALV